MPTYHLDPAKIVVEGITHYHQPPGRHPWGSKIPPFYERIELVTGGEGAILVEDGSWKEVTAGDLIWNKPGDYTIGRSNFTDPYRCLAITIVTPYEKGHQIPRFTRWNDIEEVIQFTNEAVACFRNEAFDREVLCRYVLARLLFHVNLNGKPRKEFEGPIPLQRVLRWIRINHTSPCPVEAMAKVAGWSPAHLHLAFKKHLQCSPHQMVIRERIKTARERLVSTLDPIKKIALECGFANAGAFTRLFKQHTDLTPAAYRERYLQLNR